MVIKDKAEMTEPMLWGIDDDSRIRYISSYILCMQMKSLWTFMKFVVAFYVSFILRVKNSNRWYCPISMISNFIIYLYLVIKSHLFYDINNFDKAVLIFTQQLGNEISHLFALFRKVLDFSLCWYSLVIITL